MKKMKTIAAIAALLIGACAAQAETYAVLMGINDYPQPVDEKGQPLKDEKGNVVSATLKGCVNDIKSYNDLLVNKFGVKPDHIKALYNKDANTEGFLAAIKWLMATAKPGDQVMFAYSGHGGQIEDKAEDDGIQEVIVLADDKLVAGSFFGEIAREFVKGGVNSTYVFDSCFSGGMSRDVFSFNGQAGTARKKFLDVNTTKHMAKVPSAKLTEVKASLKKAPSPAGAEYAFLFAGAEDQPTTDLDFKDEKTPDHGLFTLIFAGLLEDMPNAPLDEAIVAIKDLLKEKGFEQKPGFEFSSPARGKKPLLEKQ